MSDGFHSAIYEGRVRHRRFAPKEHAFNYTMYMMYLDLAELDRLFKNRLLWSLEEPNVASFRRSDHHGNPRESLRSHVCELVQAETGRRPSGSIRLLTHLRYYGYIFNPVSFYYCYNAEDTAVETIVAEVSNTPWNEMHCYVLHSDTSEAAATRRQFRFDKQFHVSPFMDMDQEYVWCFTEPRDQLAVHMENHEKGGKVFDATMNLRRRPATAYNMARMLALYPPMTAKVVGGIYWNALRLRIKGTPFHSHPSRRTHSQEAVKP